MNRRAGIIGSLMRMEELGLRLVEGSSRRCSLRRKKSQRSIVVKGEVPGRVATERVDSEVQYGFTSRPRRTLLNLRQPVIESSRHPRVIRARASEPDIGKLGFQIEFSGTSRLPPLYFALWNTVMSSHSFGCFR
jgi:hypothetical protein